MDKYCHVIVNIMQPLILWNKFVFHLLGTTPTIPWYSILIIYVLWNYDKNELLQPKDKRKTILLTSWVNPFGLILILKEIIFFLLWTNIVIMVSFLLMILWEQEICKAKTFLVQYRKIQYVANETPFFVVIDKNKLS
jgi:hypothetical protein